MTYQNGKLFLKRNWSISNFKERAQLSKNILLFLKSALSCLCYVMTEIRGFGNNFSVPNQEMKGWSILYTCKHTLKSFIWTQGYEERNQEVLFSFAWMLLLTFPLVFIVPSFATLLPWNPQRKVEKAKQVRKRYIMHNFGLNKRRCLVRWRTSTFVVPFPCTVHGIKWYYFLSLVKGFVN